MEILSPCGNMESLTAALKSGADAVYFGAQNFNARRNADNFDASSLKEAIKLCKIYGAKSYLTLNTIIKESELPLAFNTAKEAYMLGIDAVIVQDIGLIKLLNTHLKDLPLHASTQMTVHTPSALPFLKKLGIKRVVLSRECTKNTIKEICKKAKELNLETEVFVHGALCMSVSGQCYLSAALGGRSANRGLCAGSCRLPFKAEGGTGYDLSLKDLCLIDYIFELEKLGCTSLKIEGRMKTPEYVACATTAYKSKLNNTLTNDMKDILKDSFSRGGFTDGYYKNQPSKDMFGIRSDMDKSLSKKSEGIIHNLYRKEPSILPLDFKLVVKKDMPTTLTAIYKEHIVTVKGEIPNAAKNAPLTNEKARESLLKLGFSVYYLNNLSCEIDDGLFVSDLNVLKRKAVELLNEKRSKISPKKCECSFKFNKSEVLNKTPEIIIEVKDPAILPSNLKDIKGVVIPIKYDIKLSSIDKIAPLSRFVDDENIWKNEIDLAVKNGFTALLITNIGQIEFAKKSGLKLFGGFGLNVINSYTLNAFEDFDNVMLSPEISNNEIISGKIKTTLFAYGKLPLMLTKNCPLKNGYGCKGCKKALKDRKNKTFYIDCHNSYVEILNGVTTHIAKLPNTDYIYLSFYDEDKNEVNDIINQYKTGNFKNGENYTKALFKNGVK